MSWSDVVDPSDSWSNETDPTNRHTYGQENGKGARIVYGDNVKFGGDWSSVTDPSSSWTDETDPS